MHSVMQRIIGPGRVLTKTIQSLLIPQQTLVHCIIFCELIYYFGSLVSKMTIFVRSRRKEIFIMTYYRNWRFEDNVEPSRNKKGLNFFYLYQLTGSCKKSTIFGAARNFFGPSYFVTALVKRKEIFTFKKYLDWVLDCHIKNSNLGGNLNWHFSSHNIGM